MVKRAEVTDEAPAVPTAEPTAVSTPEPVYEAIEPEMPVLPEAGGIAWCELYGTKKDAEGIVHEVKINVTARSFTSLEALQDLLVTLKAAADGLNMYPYPKSRAPGQTSAQAPAQAAQKPAGSPPPAAQPAVEPTYEPVDGGGIFNAVKMVCTPRNDGKTKLDFFEAGHRYPDISCVLTPEQLAEMLKLTGGWLPSHFQQLGTYEPIAYKITWKNSARMNQLGKPYKNIVSVTL